ncbi:hypothetical protein LCL85_17650 [Vibrio alginolyticus]|nr:hypothetical protein [Vibrio alginolyticus]
MAEFKQYVLLLIYSCGSKVTRFPFVGKLTGQLGEINNRQGRMEEEETAMIILVLIVGLVLVWIFLEEYHYFGLYME